MRISALLSWSVAASACLALPAAALEPDTPHTHAVNLSQWTVLPSATDAKIGAPDNPHEVMLAEGLHNGKLFVFLPGTGGSPSGYKKILAVAAELGFHAIGLSYPTGGPSIVDACAANLGCYGPYRTEKIWGRDQSAKTNVGPDNCIVHRLTRLLQHLAKEHPAQRWEHFLTDGHPAWHKVVIAGHSQGGGHAFFLAKHVAVARAIAISAPSDATPGERDVKPATWLTQGAVATPREHFFAFGHTGDKRRIRQYHVDWAALGVPGPARSVDGARPPYGGAHQLLSSREVSKPHNAVVADHATPMHDGAPVYEPVWRYLIGR